MGRHYKQIDRDERMKIEALYTVGYSITEIAKQMNRNYTTIYREVRRGRTTQRNSDWTERTIYSADLAQMKYEVNKKQCGRELKIGNDYKFLNYIEKKIADEKYSPAATLMEIKKENIKFDTEICLTTLYNYIKSGVFLNLTLEELPYRRKKKRIEEFRKDYQQEQAFLKDRKRYWNVTNLDIGKWTLLWELRERERNHCLCLQSERHVLSCFFY